MDFPGVLSYAVPRWFPCIFTKYFYSLCNPDICCAAYTFMFAGTSAYKYLGKYTKMGSTYN
jgi:hypothetical protein